MSAPHMQALAEGTLGLALLHLERGDLASARPLLADAVADGVSVGANASLFHGAPALEFVLGCAGRRDPAVEDAVDRVVSARLSAADERRGSERRPSLKEFDLISGLTGMAALLLSRPRPSSGLDDVLTYLIGLATPSEGVPGWWSDDSPGHEETVGGHSNHGIAHGIAGPLAMLAIAARRGARIEGQVEAMEVFSRWLERFGAFYWVTRDQLAANDPPRTHPGRPSWCYGDLGIARALQLAAIATGDLTKQQAAEDRAYDALTDPVRLGLVIDASLCHGWAGLLAVTRAIAADSRSPQRFSALAEALSARLAETIAALPKTGFLEGRTGARLALEGSTTTGWTRALLID
ncbi:Lanthionine synthetase C-like protein [Sinosporangium album]|uniref:Lanthionine synthetase C-like protein n=1 Tax=Sinosporangium album TaxID=504805 RepID=A0A1G7U2M8_9ACTN|nr:lanthionine synthetase C family protein [Sinosporangium album]SDG41309.1 Lanthionine synthetase C-like protein [Sinosporangium album]